MTGMCSVGNHGKKKKKKQNKKFEDVIYVKVSSMWTDHWLIPPARTGRAAVAHWCNN